MTILNNIRRSIEWKQEAQNPTSNRSECSKLHVTSLTVSNTLMNEERKIRNCFPSSKIILTLTNFEISH